MLESWDCKRGSHLRFLKVRGILIVKEAKNAYLSFISFKYIAVYEFLLRKIESHGKL